MRLLTLLAIGVLAFFIMRKDYDEWGKGFWALFKLEFSLRGEEGARITIELSLISWISDVTKKYDALSWNNLEIWKRFNSEGIEIPFPQLVVHQQPGVKNESAQLLGEDSNFDDLK